MVIKEQKHTLNIIPCAGLGADEVFSFVSLHPPPRLFAKEESIMSGNLNVTNQEDAVECVTHFPDETK